MSKGLLFVGLVCLCFSAAFATQLEDFLLSVQDTPFGKTLWGTLELEMENGAPGDYLVNLLNKMKNTVEGDIKQSTSTHDKFQANCKLNIATLKNEVRQHARAVIDSKKLISKSQQKLSWDQAQIESQKRQKKEAKSGLAKIQQIRAKEAAEYAQKVKELNDALVALHEGKSLLEKNLKKKGGVSLAQISSSLSQYVEKMTMLIERPEYRGRGYVSVIAYVAEMLQAPAVQASKESTNKILNMIQKIIDELEQAKNVEYKAEQERIANFNILVEIYTKSIAELTESITKLTNEVNTMKQIINYNTNRITENTRSIQVKSRQKIKTKKECRSENSSFAKANKKRQADFNLVNSAVQIIAEHIDEFRGIVLKNAKSHTDAHYEAKKQIKAKEAS